MRKRIKLIANPVSGGDARPGIEQALRYLKAAGAHVDVYVTQKRGDATAEALALNVADFDLVIAAGGDGTLNEVANGLAGRGVPLAFLPFGTANVMALEMGIPAKVEDACRIALEGEARPVWHAETGGCRFLMMAGIGFDGAAVRAVNPRLKRLTGKFAYLVAGVSTLCFSRPQPFILKAANGRSVQVWHAIISNIRLYGGRFVLAPQAGLETAEMVACIVERPGRLALVLFWARILLRGYVLGDVRRVVSSSFNVEGTSAPVQLDGDEHTDTPLEITCVFGQLSLVFPVI